MNRKPVILISLLLAAFVINLDTTIVNVALPSLVRQLHASDAQLQWVVDAFNLLFAASVLAAGSLSDRFGRKGMLLGGLSVFGLASLAGGCRHLQPRPATGRSPPRWSCSGRGWVSRARPLPRRSWASCRRRRRASGRRSTTPRGCS